MWESPTGAREECDSVGKVRRSRAADVVREDMASVPDGCQALRKFV